MASATRSNSGVIASCCSIAARIASMGKRPVYGSSSLRISGIVIRQATRLNILCVEPASLHGEINADNLLIISGVHMPIGESRMRPQHIASSGCIGGLEQMGAADLFIAFRGEPGDD